MNVSFNCRHAYCIVLHLCARNYTMRTATGRQCYDSEIYNYHVVWLLAAICSHQVEYQYIHTYIHDNRNSLYYYYYYRNRLYYYNNINTYCVWMHVYQTAITWLEHRQASSHHMIASSPTLLSLSWLCVLAALFVWVL